MTKNTAKPKISGTKEWSVESANCVNGCGHRCRYCYARADAVRRRQCLSFDAWGTTYHHLRPHDVSKRRRKINGRVMFPTTHDIEPEFLEPCMTVLGNLLRVGNDVLVVSKPHLECIRAICARFVPGRDQITFRFSIGAHNGYILRYWEPGAPGFTERLSALRWAQKHGYATSVSAEPLLDVRHARDLVDAVSPYVTDTIWIGKMNQPRRRCPPVARALCETIAEAA